MRMAMLTQKQVEEIVRDYILKEAKKRKGFSYTQKVVFKSTRLHSIAHRPIYKSMGYFEYEKRARGRLLSFRVRQPFAAEVDADSGDLLTYNPEQEEEV